MTSAEKAYLLDPAAQKERRIPLVKPEDLALVSTESWAYTPKADGIHEKGILSLSKGEIEPYVLDPPSHYFKVFYEKIEGFPPLIFNIYKPDIEDKNIF